MTTRLGTHYYPQTKEIVFSIFSKNASCIQIYFYSTPLGSDEVLVKKLSKEGDIWSVTVSSEELTDTSIASRYIYYGYRAWGPNWYFTDLWQKGSDKGFVCDVDSNGNRFNPNKLLFDPYAKELSHDPQVARIYIDPNAYSDAYYGGENRNLDTGRIAPKSVMVLDKEDLDYGIKPKRLLKDDIIYEVNLRGFSMLDNSIPQDERGTYKGAAKRAGYLKELGVTAIEFLPVQEFTDEQNDDNDPRGDNYWGYMTLNYFSPNRRYSSDKSPGGPTREFKEMVKAFHEEGIKVFLDVVYNHTGEGPMKRKVFQSNLSSNDNIEKAIREAGPSRGDDCLQDFNAACILSYTGLDNKSYYFLRDQNLRYEGRGGCGGNLNYDNYVVKNLIIDSLKYWVHEMGVDGFRFDLAPILNLTCLDGDIYSNEKSEFFNEISNVLPSRTINYEDGVDLIAEPWGDGSCIDWSDKFPKDWSIWNAAFRDVLKISLNKYGVSPMQISEISKVVSGSKEIIGKKPWNSINYIVSHDDCNSLRNLFSYNSFFHLDEAVIKYDQISWDQGGSIEKQKKAVRNAISLLLLSAGVPMFAGGDELFRPIPQYLNGIGKMNMVSIDSPEVYLDFKKFNRMKKYIEEGNYDASNQMTEAVDALNTFMFVKNLIRFRSKHECLRPYNYFSGAINSKNGLKDISWHNKDGAETIGADWRETDFIAYRINAVDERVQNKLDSISSIYVAFNRSPEEQDIKLPPNIDGKSWYLFINTEDPYKAIYEDRESIFDNMIRDKKYRLVERSVVVLIEK